MSGNDSKNKSESGGKIGLEETQNGDMRRVESAIKEAVISAYCKENEFPIQLFDGIETAESIQLKSYARRIAEVLTGIIMKRKGPQLICFWTRQGCPELPK